MPYTHTHTNYKYRGNNESEKSYNKRKNLSFFLNNKTKLHTKKNKLKMPNKCSIMYLTNNKFF